MTLKRAVQLCRLVNIQDRSLPLTKGQVSEVAWQHVIYLTNGGRRTLLEAGSSQRKVTAMFGIGSKTTINSMVNQLDLARSLKASGKLDDEERDGYTKWPTWRAVCRRLNPQFDEKKDVELSEKVVELATKFATLIDKHGAAESRQAWRLALQDLGIDETGEEPEFDF